MTVKLTLILHLVRTDNLYLYTMMEEHEIRANHIVEAQQRYLNERYARDILHKKRFIQLNIISLENKNSCLSATRNA